MFRLTRGVWRPLVALVVLLVIAYPIYNSDILVPPSHENVRFTKPNLVGATVNAPHYLFWQQVFDVLNKGKPEVSDTDIKVLDVNKDLVKSRANLLDKADIPKSVIDEFKKKHAYVMENLHDLTTAVYNPGTSGVAIVGGGRFLWLAYLCIVSMRQAGLKLPVEIILPKYHDYENEISLCTEVFPSLNARCVVVPDQLGPQVMLKWNNKLQNYQFKLLALMTSSFQNVLLVDADNIMLTNPDEIFASDVFKEYGMILWPDYWDRVTTPVFYDIAGVKVDTTKLVRHNRIDLNHPVDVEENQKDIKFHNLKGTMPDVSTESGQLLINKATHSKTLLMSLYYNMYGPKLFYRLLSLGEPGEGDAFAKMIFKDCFQDKFWLV